jgi:hypothetical protein
MEIPYEISPEDMEKLNEIRSLPPPVVRDAIYWWNHDAPIAMKNFIIVTAYYESILFTSELADEALQQWKKE